MLNTMFCGGLSDLNDSYDGFILDPWGVLHDGVKPYDGALEALHKMHDMGKQVIVLSNSGRREQANIDRLKELGFPKKLFHHVVTPGEMTWRGLQEQTESIFKGIGTKCLLYTRGDDTEILEDLEIDLVSDPDEAEFILISNTDAPKKKIEDYEPELRRAAGRGIPAICADPDMLCLIGNQSVMGPGQIARRYQQFGGVVHFIGKPFPAIYRYTMTLFKDILPARVLVIGDSLSHDIAGGNSLDIDTCLVTKGIHAGAFAKARDEKTYRRALDRLAVNYGVRPKWLLETLRWDNPYAPSTEERGGRRRGRI